MVGRVRGGESRGEAGGVKEGAEGEVGVFEAADESGEAATGERGGPRPDGRCNSVGREQVWRRPDGVEVAQVHWSRQVRQIHHRRQAPSPQIKEPDLVIIAKHHGGSTPSFASFLPSVSENFRRTEKMTEVENLLARGRVNQLGCPSLPALWLGIRPCTAGRVNDLRPIPTLACLDLPEPAQDGDGRRQWWVG